MEIAVFLLHRVDSPQYDEYHSCVVAARDEEAARELANHECGTEGYIWTDGNITECTKLSKDSLDGISGIILWSRE